MAPGDTQWQDRVNSIWYGRSPLRFLLLPLSALFSLLAALRRALYRTGILGSYRARVPVIVVGNISVGGTGKTPVTLWLAEYLRQRGKSPAIVSRGYGGAGSRHTLRVESDSRAEDVGDEPLLLSNRSGCPVYVDRNRARAVQVAMSNGADVIVCDDGLQHYALQRDVEIVVVDAQRGLGNGHLLPAGPLRESVRRLRDVERIFLQVADERQTPAIPAYLPDADRVSVFTLRGNCVRSVAGTTEKSLADFRTGKVKAIAGIGNPQRFFDQLVEAGLDITGVALADHAKITEEDIAAGDFDAVIMTEKDAVKCQHMVDERHWFLPVDLELLAGESMAWLDERLTTSAALTG